MEKAKIVTHELDILSFQESIFAYNANFLSPVIVRPEEEFQTLSTFFKLQETLLSQWASYAGPAGIAQYSLKKGKPVGVLGRWDINFRKPSGFEMQRDFECFGEQVIGPCVNEVPKDEKEKWKNNNTFEFANQDYYFVAPDRISEMRFLSRVFEGDFPKDLTSLVQEVDGISKTNENIIHQGYHFMHAIDGKIKYAAFKNSKDFKKTPPMDYGFVERNNGELIFYPNGDRQHPIDFTEAIINE